MDKVTLSWDLSPSQEKINKMFEEIEALQSDVEYILNSKNVFVRLFRRKEAIRKHRKAQMVLDHLFLCGWNME